MCGIFGNITKTVNQLDVSSFNILGIFNIERGKNSCGITYDGEIFHGLEKDKIYSDFIKKRQIKPKLTPTLFGHTRAASLGSIVNEYNAHPFGFGDYKDGFEFIGVHNGTLRNHKELAGKYGIELKQKVTKTSESHSWDVEREKIDSEILLEILYKTKSYNVLNEYIGGAALIWTWPEQPNKVYFWSGASKKAAEDSEDKMFEERPLFAYIKGKNNMFLSSLEESLYAIGGVDENVGQIAYNTVYCVTDGNFSLAEKIQVSRRKASQEEKVISYVNKVRGFHYHEDYEDYYSKGGYPSNYPSRSSSHNKAFDSVKDNANSNLSLNIFEEKPLKPVSEYGSQVYFNKLRYWRNGHLINGIYIYVKEWGFKYIGENATDSDALLDRVKGFRFIDGEFDYLQKFKTIGTIPYGLGDQKIQKYYFIDGVNLRTYLDYSVCLGKRKEINNSSIYISYTEMSYMSKNPLISLNNKDASNFISEDGKLYSGTFSPLGSEKIYSVNSGNLVKVEQRKDIAQVTCASLALVSNSESLSESKVRLKESEDSINKIEEKIDAKESLSSLTKLETSSNLSESTFSNENCCFLPGIKEVEQEDDNESRFMPANSDDENELVMLYIEEGFEPIIDFLSTLSEELSLWSPNAKADSAVEIIEDIMNVVNEFVTVNLNEVDRVVLL
jgi:predicted glutamine amidotransferase